MIRASWPAGALLSLSLLAIFTWPLFAACGAFTDTTATAAPVAGEVAFYESEVYCLLEHAPQGLEAANKACGIDPGRRVAAKRLCRAVPATIEDTGAMPALRDAWPLIDTGGP